MNPQPLAWKRAASTLCLATAVVFGFAAAPVSAEVRDPGDVGGDGLDDAPIPVVRGFHEGTLSDAGDEDAYVSVPRPRSLTVGSEQGCFEVEVKLSMTGGTTPKALCTGQQFSLGFYGPLQPLEIAFSSGPGSYWFLLG